MYSFYKKIGDFLVVGCVVGGGEGGGKVNVDYNLCRKVIIDIFWIAVNLSLNILIFFFRKNIAVPLEVLNKITEEPSKIANEYEIDLSDSVNTESRTTILPFDYEYVDLNSNEDLNDGKDTTIEPIDSTETITTIPIVVAFSKAPISEQKDTHENGRDLENSTELTENEETTVISIDGSVTENISNLKGIQSDFLTSSKMPHPRNLMLDDLGNPYLKSNRMSICVYICQYVYCTCMIF